MEIVKELELIPSYGSEEELVRELLDDDSPLFVFPEVIELESNLPLKPTSIMNRLVSNVYSGPEIEDIERALSLTNEKQELHDQTISQSRISMFEKGLSKVENKYTLKIKNCGNGLTDDGYKWRKYGQKSIKNSPNPRSYYRCTNPKCSAKKQVERSREEPDTLIITYEGLHLHFTYSHFFPNQLHHDQANMGNPFTKKPRNSILQDQAQDNPTMVDSVSPNPFIDEPLQNPVILAGEEEGSQGLLQDIVPLMIRNPSSSSSFGSSPLPSSPPSSSTSSSSSSSSSLYWSPNYFSDLVK